ncbi:MAG: dTDP-4-amino-4,6-dideoxygalactose transaminase [Pirellulaceae bacterium]
MNQLPTTAGVPFHRSHLTGGERQYLQQVLDSGSIASDGPFTRRCAALLQQETGSAAVLLTPSCTAALEMAADLCGLKPGDEVIMPSFTFVTTASAFVRCGARPVFVDISPETLNLDPAKVERAITPRTRAIVAVHYAGVACQMDALLALADAYELVLVEDAAHALSGAYQGRPLGSLGRLGCFSFHDTKNYACGEGGALVVNDERLTERAEILRDKGTNRRQFLRGAVDKYTWVDVGSSFVPSELACAFLCAQLEQLEEIRRLRRERYDAYMRQLTPLGDAGLLTLPRIPEDCDSSYHLFHALTPTAAARQQLLDHLRRQNVGAAFHYVPLHDSPVGRRFGRRLGDLPVTEDVAARLIRLPLYPGLSPHEQQHVVHSVLSGCRLSRPIADHRRAG